MPCVAAGDFKCWCHTAHLLSSVNSLNCVTSRLMPFENSKAVDGLGADASLVICGIAIGVAVNQRIGEQFTSKMRPSRHVFCVWLCDEPFLCLEELPDFNASEFSIINGGGTFQIFILLQKDEVKH